MSLSSRVKNRIVDTINTSFAALGNANGMRMPKSENNHESIAWDLWLAKHLLSLANKRKEQAEAAAVREGVIPDTEKKPMPVGSREIIFNGNVVSISVEVRSPSTRVSATTMADYLVSKGVAPKLVNEAMLHATTVTRPAHVFTTMLISNGD